MFKIDTDRRLITVARSGLLTPEEAAEYRAALTTALDSAREMFPSLLLLIDNSQTMTMPQSAVTEMEHLAEEIADKGVAKMAMITRSAVLKMQAQRILTVVAEFQCFETDADARAWLNC